MNLKLPLIFIYLCTCFFPALAQEPSYLHYTVDDGLPSNEVYDTYEDKEGYTWFATDHGISKFDGYTFRNFSTSDGLVHNTVFGFHEDYLGRMWMRTFNSSLCYMENGFIRPYRYNGQLRTFLGRDFIQRFAFDKAGNLWFFCIRNELGLYKQEAASGKIIRVDLPDGYNGFIKELDSGELIAGIDNNNGYTAIEKPDSTLLHRGDTWLFRMPLPRYKDSRKVISAQRTGRNSFLFCFDTQLLFISNGRISFRREFPTIINNSYTEPGGKSWLCMNGVFVFEPGNKINDLLLASEFVTAIQRDRTGNYWFTTLTNGVYFSGNLYMRNFSRVHEILSLARLDNQLLTLGLDKTVHQFSLKNDLIDTAASVEWEQKYISGNLLYTIPSQQLVLISDKRFQLRDHTLIRPDGILGIGGGGGIRGYAFSSDSIFIASNLSWSVFNLKRQLLYNSLDNGFSRFCTAIAAAPGKGIWIGTTDGLFIFSKGKTVPYDTTNPVFRQRVTAIAFGKNGEVFVSTRGGGLIVIDGKKQYNLREADGLCSDQCGAICVDGNVIWLCSNNGLNRILMNRNNGTLQFRAERINTQHGLPSNMVNDVIRIGNFLYLATGKGITCFRVDQFQLNTIPPPVYIHSFLSNNRETDPEKQELSWKDNNISISFTGLLFRGQGTVHYRYRLEGYEADWNYTSDRVARYFNLPAGKYTFVVSAMNENGIWNDHPATIRFEIPAHFTDTSWFRVLLVLLIATIASLIVFAFVRQQRDRARATLAMALAEQKTLRAQMKPHFIFNSLNSIQHFILEHDEESAHLYLSRFSSLMRKILDNTRQNTIPLTREIETLRLYLDLEKLRFGENFDYTIEVSPEIITEAVELPPMLIQPYAENAIWHGLLMLRERAPRLLIRFTQENNQLICLIEDNGIGRKKAGEKISAGAHTSTGMKNIEERIALLNKVTRSSITVKVEDLYNDSNLACGTRITLTIPMSMSKK